MTNKETKEKYINRFKKELSRYILNTAGVDIQLFNSKDGGGVVKATLNNSGRRKSSIAGNYQVLGEAVASSGQRAFAGDLTHIKFEGTNTIVDGNTIFLIKSPSAEEWSNKKASQDVEGIIRGGKK
ncbi:MULTISPECIES: hypothetical protein [Enterobacteriaceae]|mgnify:FL=1|uniref:hypothetical protein n=1 Tax=Enterobacteriaceae TaxID=543 RepID=UPI0009BEC24C|nr:MULTISPECIES: hypothetical protein [Enterobacteriaceae]DAP14658.1 MAG TPA: hypothetical protein [Caudoviricetes sp.]HBY0608541.1 hypothetical protein [Klebsiella pneumoniae subsp. pneumoniae]EFA4573800.1 hypothetical protein [Escherichia coli]EFA4615232.1 hypothetical protein [Escherichia coli]EFM0421366.1 hypothetical protein [Escherichia coli]